MQTEPQEQQPKKSSVWVVVAVVVGLAAAGVGLKVAADKDRAFCEARVRAEVMRQLPGPAHEDYAEACRTRLDV